MENDENKLEIPTLFNLEKVVTKLEEITGQKAHKETKLKTDYQIGNIEVTDLEDLGFEFVGYSNGAGYETPVYRMGNIEAIYIGQTLHIYEITTM